MKTVSAQIDIAAPPDQVWELLTDPHRWGEWQFTFRGVTGVDEVPLARGSTYTERAGLGPLTVGMTWRVTESVHLRRQVHAYSSARSNARITVELAPMPGGTRYRQQLQAEILPGRRPVGALAELVLEPVARAGLRRVVAGLKRTAEQDPAEDGTGRR